MNDIATLFTAIVMPYGTGQQIQVGGLVFNDGTPTRVIRARWPQGATIARLQTWPTDLTIPQAMDLALAAARAIIEERCPGPAQTAGSGCLCAAHPHVNWI